MYQMFEHDNNNFLLHKCLINEDIKYIFNEINSNYSKHDIYMTTIKHISKLIIIC
jgi:hypothetical protein